MSEYSLHKIPRKARDSGLQEGNVAGLDIFLMPEDFKLTQEWFEKCDPDFLRNLDLYFQRLSADTPPNVDLLIYETGFSRLLTRVTLWCGLVSNVFSRRTTNVPAVSKNMYEELAKNQRETNFDLRPIVALRDGRPVLTTRWAQQFDAADSFRRAFEKVKATNILECGVGEGSVPFSYVLQFPEQFSNLNWCGFDFSIHRVLSTRSLFKNHFATKDLGNTCFYNGDAKNLIHGDKTFDAAISCCVLEQIKYGKKDAISEMARVAKYVIVREPIFEHQSIFAKAHFRKNDYVCLHMQDLEEIGEIVSVEKHSLADPTYAYTTVIVKTK